MRLNLPQLRFSKSSLAASRRIFANSSRSSSFFFSVIRRLRSESESSPNGVWESKDDKYDNDEMMMTHMIKSGCSTSIHNCVPNILR